MSEKKILLVGMPESGKTTFIAALWDAVLSNNPTNTLKNNTLKNSDTTYLNRIRELWLEYKPLSRTNIKEIESAVMNLTETSTGKNFIINIPDLSGETFNIQFQTREWTLAYDNILDEIDSIALFVNPTDPKNITKYISNSNYLENFLGEESKTENTKTYESWSEEHTSNQVKMVEALQFIEYYKLHNKTIKVAVIISAWDLVDADKDINPQNWIKTNLPLLYQYLITNNEVYELKFYGISAQGGNYSLEDEVNAMIEKKPYERIITKEGEEYTNNISSPIIWLIE